MSGAATDLWETASQLLDFCTVALDEGTDAGAPERRFVSVGFPPVDCPTLAVFVFPVAPGPFAPTTSPGDVFRQAHPYPVLDMVTMQVQVWRCWPSTPGYATPKAPKPADYDFASRTLYTDAWQLYNAIREGFKQGLLGGPCKLERVDQAQPLQPNGGLGGFGVLVTVQLDGHDPLLPDPVEE